MTAETMTNLKTFACGFAALALTAVMSWSFVDATSSGRWLVQGASNVTASVAVDAATRVAQTAQAALVD